MSNQSLSVSDVARQTGVSAHTLRYYERIGLLPEVERAASGHRRYGERHIRWVRFLRRLRAAGMPISQMQRYVALYTSGGETSEERLAMLADHRQDVIKRIEELQAHLEILDRKLQHGCSPTRESSRGEGGDR